MRTVLMVGKNHKVLERWCKTLDIEQPTLISETDPAFRHTFEFFCLYELPVISLDAEAEAECEIQKQRLIQKYSGRVQCKVYTLKNPGNRSRKFVAEMLQRCKRWLAANRATLE